jgi:hypothetical protein
MARPVSLWWCSLFDRAPTGEGGKSVSLIVVIIGTEGDGAVIVCVSFPDRSLFPRRSSCSSSERKFSWAF